ncbi:MAG: lysophospholipid acyltransferase family protein [Candidatus Rokuibacteriota bacterium]
MTGPGPSERPDRLYATVRAGARFWLWFFFKAVDVRHPERVPPRGAVLLCINHPNNLIDSLLVGAVLRRTVHYLATAALFRNPLLGRFLLACGAIPVYRRQDDPDRMDRNTDAFAACGRVFEQGRLVAIYPEGTTHSESRVQRIRTGAARIALGYEAARPGELTVLPVGLTFEARKSFRARVLVSFGPAVPVGAYLPAYREDSTKAVDALTETIQWAMEAEVVNVERIDDTRLVRAVEELYRSDLVRALVEERGVAPGHVDHVRLSRGIVDAVAHFKTRDPERVERLWQRIQAYRALLARYGVRDDAVRGWRERRPRRQRLKHGWEAVVGLPIFVYGAVVTGLPYYLPRVISHRLARKETDYATIRLLASIVAFPLFWGLETWIVWRATSAGWAALFALSLPVSGALAYRYLVGTSRFRASLRFTLLAVRQRQDAGRLVAERAAIIAALEQAKNDYLAATKGSSF